MESLGEQFFLHVLLRRAIHSWPKIVRGAGAIDYLKQPGLDLWKRKPMTPYKAFEIFLGSIFSLRAPRPCQLGHILIIPMRGLSGGSIRMIFKVIFQKVY